MSSTRRLFDFTEFARRIYLDRPDAHRHPFLLPALYGGESSQRYEALFVLQDPSVSFTEHHWKPCETAEMAIRTHRTIFLEWAHRGKQSHLFRLFEESLSSGAKPSPIGTASKGFFRRFYVTDIWKDAAFKQNGRDREYREYWLAKLALELENVRARRVIFVGQEAELGQRFVPSGTQIHHIPFPGQWIAEEVFKGHVARLGKEVNPRLS
jgi:hypothetical protein